MCQKRTPLGLGAAISLSGLGIPVLLWVLGELAVHLPTFALYGLLALAILVVAGPWVLIGIQRIKYGKEPEKLGVTDDDEQLPTARPKASGLRRTAMINRETGIADLSRAKIGSGYEVGIDNEGIVDASEAQFDVSLDEPAEDDAATGAQDETTES